MNIKQTIRESKVMGYVDRHMLFLSIYLLLALSLTILGTSDTNNLLIIIMSYVVVIVVVPVAMFVVVDKIKPTRIIYLRIAIWCYEAEKRVLETRGTLYNSHKEELEKLKAKEEDERDA